MGTFNILSFSIVQLGTIKPHSIIKTHVTNTFKAFIYNLERIFLLFPEQCYCQIDRHLHAVIIPESFIDLVKINTLDLNIKINNTTILLSSILSFKR